METIHKHDVFAERGGTIGEIRAETRDGAPPERPPWRPGWRRNWRASRRARSWPMLPRSWPRAWGAPPGRGLSREAPAGRSSRRDPVEMVAVPGGDFLMGSDDPEADADERPAKRIRVEAFWIDRVEVTNARYGACVEAGACSLPAGAA